MSTAWTPANDLLQGAALRLAKVVEEASGGRFQIEVFPGGQIIPPFECFDAASKGTVEAFMAVSAYWSDKEPAFECFHTVPFRHEPRRVKMVAPTGFGSQASLFAIAFEGLALAAVTA